MDRPPTAGAALPLEVIFKDEQWWNPFRLTLVHKKATPFRRQFSAQARGDLVITAPVGR